MTITLNNISEPPCGVAKMLPEKIVSPPQNSDDKFGIVFDFTGQKDLDKNCSAYFYKGQGSNLWVLPYRYFTQAPTYTNPTGAKYMQAALQRDSSSKSDTFKFSFPYKMLFWYINDDEGKKIATSIGTNRNTIQNKLAKDKITAVNAGNSYLSSKPILDSLTKDANSLAAQKASVEKDIADITSTITTQSKDVEAAQAELSKALSILNSAQTSFNSVNDCLLSTQDLLTKKQGVLKDLNDNKAGADLPEKKELVEKSTKAFNEAIENIKTNDAPNSADILKSISDMVLTKLTQPTNKMKEIFSG